MPNFFRDFPVCAYTNTLSNQQKNQFTRAKEDSLTIEVILKAGLLNNPRSKKLRHILFDYVCKNLSNAAVDSSERKISLQKKVYAAKFDQSDLLRIIFELAQFDNYCAMKLFTHYKIVWQQFIKAFDKECLQHHFHNIYNIFKLMDKLSLDIDFLDPNKPFHFEKMRDLIEFVQKNEAAQRAINAIISLVNSSSFEDLQETKIMALDEINQVSKPWWLGYQILSVLNKLFDSEFVRTRIVRYEIFNELRARVKAHRAFIDPSTPQKANPRVGLIPFGFNKTVTGKVDKLIMTRLADETPCKTVQRPHSLPQSSSKSTSDDVFVGEHDNLRRNLFDNIEIESLPKTSFTA